MPPPLLSSTTLERWHEVSSTSRDKKFRAGGRRAVQLTTALPRNWSNSRHQRSVVARRTVEAVSQPAPDHGSLRRDCAQGVVDRSSDQCGRCLAQVRWEACECLRLPVCSHLGGSTLEARGVLARTVFAVMNGVWKKISHGLGGAARCFLRAMSRGLTLPGPPCLSLPELTRGRLRCAHDQNAKWFGRPRARQSLK